MRLTNKFGTQMKNTHTGRIRIRIRMRIYTYAISEKYAAGIVHIILKTNYSQLQEIRIIQKICVQQI